MKVYRHTVSILLFQLYSKEGVMILKKLVQKAIQAMSFGQDRRPLVALVCEHPATQYATISAFGDVAITRLPTAEDGIPIYCGDCITKMSCQCARCGRSIFVGDPVCIFSSVGGDIYAAAEIFSTHPKRYVGCMRPDCAPLKGSRSGVWSIGTDGQQGRVSRVSDDPDRYIEAMQSRRRILHSG